MKFTKRQQIGSKGEAIFEASLPDGWADLPPEKRASDNESLRG
jgi:hypothetical protein